MKHRFSTSLGLALAFILVGGLAFLGFQALEAKGRPLPPWEVAITDTSLNLTGQSDDGSAVFDGYKGDDDELVWVGVVGSTTFALAFENNPINHAISFPDLEFYVDGEPEPGPFCGFPIPCDVGTPLGCLNCFMGQDHTLPDYNLYIRVYTKGDPPVDIEDINTSAPGGLHIELYGYDPTGTLHDVECRIDPDVTGDAVDIARIDDNIWSTSTNGARLECEEQYWDCTQHPRNKKKWICEKKVAMTAYTDFTFEVIWTETK